MVRNIRLTALNLLARREHSKFELKRKLLERNYEASEIDEILEALEKEGLQSDVRFAECYIRSRIRSGFGPLRIRNELQVRGIAGNIIDDSLNSADIDWAKLALLVYKKKFGDTIPVDLKERAKRINFLIYKGHNWVANDEFLQE